MAIALYVLECATNKAFHAFETMDRYTLQFKNMAQLKQQTLRKYSSPKKYGVIMERVTV